MKDAKKLAMGESNEGYKEKSHQSPTMIKGMGGESSPKKRLMRSSSRSQHAAAPIGYRSLAGSLASKKSQGLSSSTASKKPQHGSLKSLPGMKVSKTPQAGSVKTLPAMSGSAVESLPAIQVNPPASESIAGKPLPSAIAAKPRGPSRKSEKSRKMLSSKKRSKHGGGGDKYDAVSSSSRRPVPPRTLDAPGAGSPTKSAPQGGASDGHPNGLASSLGELVATGVLRADNAALLMTITPGLTLETVLDPQQILQLANTLRLYTKLEIESKKSATSTIEKAIVNMSAGCAEGQPGALGPRDAVPWDTMVEPWVCQAESNGVTDGPGGLPVIMEDSPGIHNPLGDSGTPGILTYKHQRATPMPSPDAVSAPPKGCSPKSSRVGSQDTAGQSRGRNIPVDMPAQRERARAHAERHFGNDQGNKGTAEAPPVGCERKSRNKQAHAKRPTRSGSVGTQSITRDSARCAVDNRSSKSQITNERSISTDKARSRSRGKAPSRQRDQDFRGSVSIITGDSSRVSGKSGERRRWGSTDRNVANDEPEHRENTKKGQALLRLFRLKSNKTREADEEDDESDFDEEDESDDDEESDDDDETLTTVEGSVDIMQRKKTLKNWMESRKKNKQPPLEKRVHNLLAAGREKKANKKKDGDFQGGLLATESEDQSSTGSLNTFTSIPSQVVVIGETVETPVGSSTIIPEKDVKKDPSPSLRPDPDGRIAVVDNDSLDQLRRLFHVNDLPELDVGTDKEVMPKIGARKKREDRDSQNHSSDEDPLFAELLAAVTDADDQEPINPDSGRLRLDQKRYDETMKLLMSFSKSVVTADGSGSGSNGSVVSDDSNSTEGEGSLVEVIANNLLETSSIRHMLLGSGLAKRLKKHSGGGILARKLQIDGTLAVQTEESNEDFLARTYSDISREAARQGCAPALTRELGVECRPCPLPGDPNLALSPTAVKKSTLFFMEATRQQFRQAYQHTKEQLPLQPKQQQQQQQQQQQLDSKSPASHESNTVPEAAVTTSDSSCSAATPGHGIVFSRAKNNSDGKKEKDKVKKNSNNSTKKDGTSSSPGFWNWLSG